MNDIGEIWNLEDGHEIEIINLGYFQTLLWFFFNIVEYFVIFMSLIDDTDIREIMRNLKTLRMDMRSSTKASSALPAWNQVLFFSNWSLTQISKSKLMYEFCWTHIYRHLDIATFTQVSKCQHLHKASKKSYRRSSNSTNNALSGPRKKAALAIPAKKQSNRFWIQLNFAKYCRIMC